MPKVSPNDLKEILEKSVKAERFSERTLYALTEPLRGLPYSIGLNAALQSFLTPAEIETVHRRLSRIAFFIERVNADVTSTKYDVRWSERLIGTDPRRASFDECFAIHESLLTQLTKLLSDEAFRAELRLGLEWGRSPHEFPVDYVSKAALPIHSRSNVQVFRDPSHLRLLNIRRTLLDPKLNPDGQLFEGVFEKIRVKSYLTDRAQTGDFKTNREKRWEAHPQSPQFALRRDCFAVELQLIDQLFRFHAFPSGIIQYLKAAKLLGETAKVARCPVTLDPLDFEILAQDVDDPNRTQPRYEIAHANPLDGQHGAGFRHGPDNIEWQTASSFAEWFIFARQEFAE